MFIPKFTFDWAPCVFYSLNLATLPGEQKSSPVENHCLEDTSHWRHDLEAWGFHQELITWSIWEPEKGIEINYHGNLFTILGGRGEFHSFFSRSNVKGIPTFFTQEPYHSLGSLSIYPRHQDSLQLEPSRRNWGKTVIYFKINLTNLNFRLNLKGQKYLINSFELEF